MEKSAVTKLLICIIVLFSLFYLLLINNSPAIGGMDSLHYILLAKSLLLGYGYKDVCFVGSPPHTMYPFVFPILLVPIIYFLGYNYAAFNLLGVVIAILSLCSIYLLFREKAGKPTALLIVLLTGLSSHILYYIYGVLAEIPYLFFSIIALIFIEKYHQEERWLSKSAFLAVFFLALAYFTRSVGICLLLAALAYLFLERLVGKDFSLRLKKLTLIGLGVCVPASWWLLRCYLLKRSGTADYLTYLFFVRDPVTFKLTLMNSVDFLEKTVRNVYGYAAYTFPRILLDVQFPQRNILAFLLTGLVFFGFLYCLYSRRTIIEYYIVFYMCMLFIWPGSDIIGRRFLVPIIPFVFYYFIIGLRQSLSILRLKKLKISGFILVICLLVVFNFKGTLGYIHGERYRYAQWLDLGKFMGMAQWAKKNTSTDAIFTSSIPLVVWLYFERKATHSNLISADPSKVIDFIYENNVDYVIVDSTLEVTKQYIKPVIEQYPDKFTVVFKEKEDVIYKVKRP